MPILPELSNEAELFEWIGGSGGRKGQYHPLVGCKWAGYIGGYTCACTQEPSEYAVMW